jgi:formylglycine-generating enzyme required for sulfatase activity
MHRLNKLNFTVLAFIVLSFCQLNAQKLVSFRLPDTGQSTSFTATQGEDDDFVFNPQSFTDNGDGTITDNVSKLMWQKSDGGEMTFENAVAYCNNLTLAGYTDWRLPTGMELFSINNFDHLNPALNTTYYTTTTAEYWWTSELRADDATKVWLVNAGGGIGAHPKTETISAGGTKRVHVRVVRNPVTTTFSVSHFTDNGNGTITDNYTGLTWQKIQSPNTLSWEQALVYANTFSLAEKADWRLPNIKEIQSLNDPSLSKPSFNKTFFPNCLSGNYWSSTTILNADTKAWDINIDYGIVSYNEKTLKENVLLVRGGMDNADSNISEALIPGGEFEMGDHFGFVDPSHPSDELPLHTVKVNSFYMEKTEATNQQFLAFLNDALLKGLIEVRSNIVYAKGGSDIYCYTNQFASYYSIGYDGKVFSIVDFRANHPVTGVMWFGVAAYCNWLSLQNNLEVCYNLATWACDFTKNGYRLPTEAEWEYAGRGGQTNPYFNYPWGNDQDITKANWPESKDPYEGTDVALYPFTTPVGFYDGTLRQKSDFNWPGSAASYQTSNGANGFGLYDMVGNVWELIYDWYGQNYYSISPYDNPTGPATGFIMPDGKAYRGMRGGNWYNGYSITSINDGHSRVSNRNPSYYRGPQDPNHPWYHIGFRTARGYPEIPTGVRDNQLNTGLSLRNYPNPCKLSTTISFNLPKDGTVKLCIYNSLGKLVEILANERLSEGSHTFDWITGNHRDGIYFFSLQYDKQIVINKIVVTK